MSPRPLFSLAATLVFLLLAAACAPQEAPEGRQRSPEQLARLLEDAVSDRVPGSERSAREQGEPPPHVEWPAGWRLLDEGRFGGGETSTAWYQLDAGELPPDEAAEAGVRALRGLVGTLDQENLSVTSATGRAVGQISGSLAWGAVDARGTDDGTEVRVLLELKAGV